MSYYPPDCEAIAFAKLNRLKGIVGRYEPNAGIIFPDAFNGKLTIEVTNRNFAVGRLQAFVHNKQVAIKNAGIAHGISFCPGIKSSRWVTNQVPVKVDRQIDKIGCRRGKSGTNPFEYRKSKLGIGLRGVDIEVLGAM